MASCHQLKALYFSSLLHLHSISALYFNKRKRQSGSSRFLFYCFIQQKINRNYSRLIFRPSLFNYNLNLFPAHLPIQSTLLMIKINLHTLLKIFLCRRIFTCAQFRQSHQIIAMCLVFLCQIILKNQEIRPSAPSHGRKK